MAQVVDIFLLGSQGYTHLIINSVAADGMVIQGARASAAMILTWFARNNLHAAWKGLIQIKTSLIEKKYIIGEHQ